jgi:hypothetical protein
MASYHAVVLVPSRALGVEEQTNVLMAPFERDLEVPPKYYLEPGEIQQLAKRYSVSVTDLESIYAHWRLEDISEDATAGLDEQGLYWFDTQNPQGEWTRWSILDTAPSPQRDGRVEYSHLRSHYSRR